MPPGALQPGHSRANHRNQLRPEEREGGVKGHGIDLVGRGRRGHVGSGGEDEENVCCNEG